MGWDGKPIPYWLYKLHGLGKEFKCEICGGASYWGRRAFEKHFQEWRHTFGMKCLRIPNQVHFKDITDIEHALKLHKKILKENFKNSFKPDIEEEFEDAHGNLYTRKQYIDMKR
jgi:splicing factor 3A subunit 3